MTAGLTSIEIIAIVQAWQAGAESREQMEGVFLQEELFPKTSLTETEGKAKLLGTRALI